jgi:GDP-mannose pyrophosphatase NudK
MKAKIIVKEILSKRWAEYSQYTLEYTRNDGRIEIQKREMQDTGHGAAVLLYNLKRKTIILIEQFRLAALLYGHPTGVITEVCAGLVENDDPEETARREIQEETGVIVENVQYLFSAYSTPGAKTEKTHYFIAEYDALPENPHMGLEEEQEDIIVKEWSFDLAYQCIFTGEIEDAKTIILLQYADKYLFKP